MLAPLSDALTIFHAGANGCQSRTLGAGESCRVAIAAPRPGANDEQFDWTVDTGPHCGLTLHFERRAARLSVVALNR